MNVIAYTQNTTTTTTADVQEFTMSSLDFLNNVINPAREECGENKIENRKFLIKIVDEIDELPAGQKVRLAKPQGGFNEVMTYPLNKDQMLQVGMRESKGVRKSVVKKINEMTEALSNQKPPSTVDILRLACTEIERLSGIAVELKEESDDKTFGLMTGMQLLRTRSSAKVRELNVHLEEEGYITQIMDRQGRSLGYRVMDKGSKYMVERGGAGMYCQVFYRECLKEVLPEEFAK